MIRNIFGLLLNYCDASRSIQCIQSLLDEDISRIFVWDNSADGGCSSADIRNAFADDKRVYIHVSTVNLGFARGVNGALELCAGIDQQSWVLLINNDAQLLPGGLSRLAAALECEPQACLAFPNISHAGQVRGPAYAHRLSGLMSWQAKSGWFTYASGCCMLLALNRLDLPLFDEDFFMYGEDCELGWRMSHRPNSLVHVNETLVEHEGSMSSGLGSPFYENAMVAAHLVLARKLALSPREKMLLLIVRSAMLLLRATIRSIRFRSLVPWKALLQGWRIAHVTRYPGYTN